MAKLSEMAKGIGRDWQTMFRAAKKRGDSLVELASLRAFAVGLYAETRSAQYALAWGLETGRASTAFEAALVAMSPAQLAQSAIDIASAAPSLNDAWAAWQRLVQASPR